MKSVVKLLGVAAVVVPLAAFAQIANTAHDMSSLSTTTGPKATTETQTCKMCHTPHKALVQTLIWNHAPTAQTVGWAGAQTTTAGTPLPTSLNASSMRCMACHDGTVAIGEVNNMEDGVAGQIVGLTATMPTDHVIPSAGGEMGAAGNANHPVSIPYAGDTVGTVTSLAGPKDGTIGNFFAEQNAGCTSPSGFCTAAPISGMNINLKGTALGALSIECVTCHEPHSKYPFDFFLRASQDQSQICKSCHNK